MNKMFFIFSRVSKRHPILSFNLGDLRPIFGCTNASYFYFFWKILFLNVMWRIYITIMHSLQVNNKEGNGKSCVFLDCVGQNKIEILRPFLQKTSPPSITVTILRVIVIEYILIHGLHELYAIKCILDLCVKVLNFPLFWIPRGMDILSS